MPPIDLATLDTRRGAEAGFTLPLVHPKSGARLGTIIRLLGADADVFQAKLREQVQQNRERFNRAGRIVQTPEEDRADGIELVVAATLGWTELIVDGAEVPFSAQAARLLYERFPWIYEQVEKAVNDRGNFLPGAATP